MTIKTMLVGAGLGLQALNGFGQVKPDSVMRPPAGLQAPEPPASPVSLPGMAGPLLANPNPMVLPAGRYGTIYVSGVASSLTQVQTHANAGDPSFRSDVSNAQIFIQKNEGLLQFFIQVGGYSIPDLGVATIRSKVTADLFYGLFPQGFLKLAPTKNFSVMAGKLPTLMGAEYTFSFENMNIQRGLLWNQENAVNRGLQVNYTAGPLVLAVSLNDGQYSRTYNWLSGAATLTLTSTSSLALIGTGSLSRNAKATAATPLYQNNEQLYDLIYTRTAGAWTIQPYLQYTYVPASPTLGTGQSAGTAGAAVLATYAVPHSRLRLPWRVEYITSTGPAGPGAPNLLYGAGSAAWSLTATPTYQYQRFFGRTELSFVQASRVTSGAAFGSEGNDLTQGRALLEVGVLF